MIINLVKLFKLYVILIIISYVSLTDLDPCGFENSNPKKYSTPPSNLCLRNAPSLPVLSIENITIHHVTEVNTSVCDVIIEFDISRIHGNVTDSHRYNCPGICTPIPVITMSSVWLKSRPPISTALTCTSTFEYVSGTNNHKSFISNLLRHIFWRRIQECNEQKHWIGIVPDDLLYRRKVYGLFLWIGSTTNMELLSNQTLVLDSAPFDGDEAVIGWGATEDVHPCRDDTFDCKLANTGAYNYGTYLPGFGALKNLSNRNNGWKCAQRRPLRALAHTLLLFDPTFLLLGDDDTFMNYNVIRNMTSLIRGSLTNRPLVVGKLINVNTMVISRNGFFFGGAGYFMGKQVLSRLVGLNIVDEINENIKHFVSWNLPNMAKKVCSGKPLVYEQNSTGDSILPMRLVDLCTYVYSGENTCFNRY